MGIFKKLFRRKKNEIYLTPEEAYLPLSENTEESAPVPASDVSDTAPEDDARQAPEPVFVADVTQPVSDEEKAALGFDMYFCADRVENGGILIRSALRAAGTDIRESDDGYEVTLPDGSSINAVKTLLPGEASLPEEMQKTLPEAPEQVRSVLRAFNHRVRVSPERRGEGFEEAYKEFIATLAFQLDGFIAKDGALTDREGRLLWNRECQTEYQAPAPEPVESGSQAETETDEAPKTAETAQALETPAPVREDAQEDVRKDVREVQKLPELTRAERSCRLIAEHGIKLDCSRAVETDEERVFPRGIKETIERAAALAATALIAKAYTSLSGLSPAAFGSALINRYDRLYGVKLCFTPKEAKYLRDPSSGKHSENALKIEAAATLLWAIGMCELGWPDKGADAEQLNAILKSRDLRTVCATARTRDKSELLDMYDLTTRLHALCVRASAEEIKQTGLDPDIIYERHYALNWLLGVGDFSSWDNIIPMT